MKNNVFKRFVPIIGQKNFQYLKTNQSVMWKNQHDQLQHHFVGQNCILMGRPRNASLRYKKQTIFSDYAKKNIQGATNYIFTKMHMPKHTPKNAGLKNKKRTFK